MNDRAVADYIVGWLADYLRRSGARGFVVGISGGIDSAVVSTLAAMTGAPALCVSLPIHQPEDHLGRAETHIRELQERFPNVVSATADLSAAYDVFMSSFAPEGDPARIELAGANTRARLRMTALYYYAGVEGLLVAGTGNKVEDFGIGFFTKYGDGGVDISPIGGLTKTEVYSLGRYLGVCGAILGARPSDGLFADARSDEEQIGATYPELERAMEQASRGVGRDSLTGREREVYDIYVRRNRANRHKMELVPVCEIPDGVKLS